MDRWLVGCGLCTLWGDHSGRKFDFGGNLCYTIYRKKRREEIMWGVGRGNFVGEILGTKNM